MDSRQSDVFDYSIRSTVDDILNGYNGTVFAYGQTGAGKSYTMNGGDKTDPESRGVIPRITEQIFASILASDPNIEYTVKVSYMEIYMERIRDLLRPQNDNLPIHEDKSRGVYVKGLFECFVQSIEEVNVILQEGGNSRQVASTNMNQESSRSHSIFVVTITQKNVDTGSGKTGQLFLVDLAGSEKVGKTGASGQTLEEAKKINKSLSSLGNVINALTDGKSSHIPYRDSKLTRILQESLGGNSRTTLIINCSPSSYNDAETISTLRFGVRAKSIKNNAKVNQEMSSSELKAHLRKAQSESSTFKEYISLLEEEIGTWRRGESVPKERWTPALKGPATRPITTRPPSTPNILQEQQRRGSETPSRPGSRLDMSRAMTPTSAIDRDEREEFLERENELQDQIAEKESAISTAEKALREAQAEVKELRDRSSQVTQENEKLNGDNENLRMQVERTTFDIREQIITLDSYKDANKDLTTELDEIRKELIEVKVGASQSAAGIDQKEALKKERMAQMMAGFDMDTSPTSESEAAIHDSIRAVDRLLNDTDETSASPLHDLREKLVTAQVLMKRHDSSVEASNLHEQASPETSSDGKTTEELQAMFGKQREENARLKLELETMRKASAPDGPTAATNGANNRFIEQKLADFDVMKKSLMRDLQNRCERVVELEISLDSTREQYQNVLRSANSKQQQKKLAFLERNLEQLTIVQRSLVEQNATLKKDVSVSERKLVARAERIHGLEALLVESQERLMQSNHRYVTILLRPEYLKCNFTDISQVRATTTGRQRTSRSESFRSAESTLRDL